MTIAEALRAAARYVEMNLPSIAWDRETVQSDEDKARITAEVSALGHDLDGLAAASETAPVYPREYEAIKGELQRRGFFLTPEIAQAVADAFQAERLTNVPPPRRSGTALSRGTPASCAGRAI